LNGPIFGERFAFLSSQASPLAARRLVKDGERILLDYAVLDVNPSAPAPIVQPQMAQERVSQQQFLHHLVVVIAWDHVMAALKVIICTVPPPVTFVWDCSKSGRNNSSRFVVGRADSQLLQVCFECFGPGQIISNLMPIRSYHCAKTGSNSDSNNNHQKRFSHKHYWTPRMVECAMKILKTCII